MGDLTVSVTSDQAFPADAMLYASIIQDPARVTKIEEEVSKAIDKGAAEEVLALDIGIYLNGEELDLEEDHPCPNCGKELFPELPEETDT